MLKLRVITALVLAPLVIWGIYGLSANAFQLIFSLVVTLAAWEWARFAGYDKPVYRIAYMFVVFSLLYLVHLYIDKPSVALILSSIVLLWWMLVLIRLVSYRQRERQPGIKPLPTLLAGLPVLLGTYLSMILLHQNYGPTSIVILMMLVWGADTAAYFSGKQFGKHKLLPAVSPGKTLEGVWGALAASVLISYAATFWIDNGGVPLTGFILTGLLTVIFSIVGDLNESLYKRQAGLKDSSNLLPGHGGILDRIDSLTAAAPVFVCGLWLMKV